MRILGLAVVLLAASGLAGCGDAAQSGSAVHPGGRYAGIGIYAPGEMWQRMANAEHPRDNKAATLRDDEAIIVVVDTRTGELRQCGNLSGYCIGMNPWTRSLDQGHALPANLTEHLADVQRARAQQSDAATTDQKR